MKKCNVMIALFLCMILVLSGCGKGGKNLPGNPSAGGGETQPGQNGTTVQEQVPITAQGVCPLTGLSVEPDQASLRPIAVMIDNMSAARPQSGLINADIVYEMPAEGGITRYMAIFHHQSSDKIGPVRSARSYFIDTAMEFNAVYVHCGGSPEALGDIPKLKVDSLNELKGERNFWRARDRKMPHNLYTSTTLTREVMDAKKLSQKKWDYSLNFSDSFLDLNGKAIKGLEIDYKHSYKAGYEYDANQKLFYRTINGVRMKDKETDKEVTAVNIIVERVSAKITDEVGRLDLSNTGTGRGYLVTGGKLIEIQWNKENRQAKTKYTDLKGNLIQLNKGNTWIQIVPDYSTIEIKE